MTGFRVHLPALAELIVRLAAFEQRASTVADELDRQVQRLHGSVGRAHDNYGAAVAANGRMWG